MSGEKMNKNIANWIHSLTGQDLHLMYLIDGDNDICDE